jgi:hypothetical protein
VAAPPDESEGGILRLGDLKESAERRMNSEALFLTWTREPLGEYEVLLIFFRVVGKHEAAAANLEAKEAEPNQMLDDCVVFLGKNPGFP